MRLALGSHRAVTVERPVCNVLSRIALFSSIHAFHNDNWFTIKSYGLIAESVFYDPITKIKRRRGDFFMRPDWIGYFYRWYNNR